MSKQHDMSDLLRRIAVRWPEIAVPEKVVEEAVRRRLSHDSRPLGADEDFALAVMVLAEVPSAWDVFYREQWDGALRVARHHCQSEHHAEEICQDFFGEARHRLRSYSGVCKLSGWMAIATRGAVCDWYRKHPNADPLPGPGEPGGDPAVPDAGGNPRHRIEERDCYKMLQTSFKTAWSRLDTEMRDLLTWKFLDGMKSREIMVVLQIREDVVSKRLKRALARLEELMRGHARAEFQYDEQSVDHCAGLVLGRYGFTLGE